MQAIQKQIVLASLVKILVKESRTRTHLRRYGGFAEHYVEGAIEFGVEKDVLRILSQGYVECTLPNYSILESDYYHCIAQMLDKHYKERLTKDGRFILSKTARKDSKIAGRWTRPDFTVIANRKFPYIREPEFDIVTFEVKRPEDCEALAVFEALAHNSAATRSYVFFPVTETQLTSNPQGERIREECVRHGIGMFLVKDNFKLEEAYIAIESQRRPLNPEKCSQFLQSVLEQKELSELTTWP